MEIRLADKKDLKDIMGILNYSIINENARFDEKPFDYDEINDWYKIHTDSYPVFVAVIDDVVAGWACVGPFSAKSAFRYTVENSLYIHQDYRGMGIGKVLLDKTIKESKALGYHSILALITGNNKISIKLHERFGFKSAGNMKEVGFKFNEWLDVNILELLL
jgi:L-amino acid N-acyltransferase YncA